jgi:hypothetical protein
MQAQGRGFVAVVRKAESRYQSSAGTVERVPRARRILAKSNERFLKKAVPLVPQSQFPFSLSP